MLDALDKIVSRFVDILFYQRTVLLFYLNFAPSETSSCGPENYTKVFLYYEDYFIKMLDLHELVLQRNR